MAMAMRKITHTLRASVLGYFESGNDDDKLLYFNKIVSICTTNTVRLFIGTRTLGIGRVRGKAVKDNPIKDLAEEFVLEQLFEWRSHSVADVRKACDSGTFDYLGNAFKHRVMNKIRDVKRSREEEWVSQLPDDHENKSSE